MADTSTDDIILNPLQGDGSPLRDWLTSYPLLLVALDPYTAESSWILDTASKFLEHYAPSDIRVGWLVASDDDGAREFLGPLAEKHLTFTDPKRSVIKAFKVDRLPALIAARPDSSYLLANGWDPEAWRHIAADIANMLGWYAPLVPAPGDPKPYAGSPAAG